MTESQSREPLLWAVEDAPLLLWRGGETHVLAKGEDTRNAYALVHVYMDADQSRAVPCPGEIGYYVLSGGFRLLSEYGAYNLTSGSFVNLPRDTAHEVSSFREESVSFLSFVAPAVEDLWVEDSPEYVDVARGGESDRSPVIQLPSEGDRTVFLGEIRTMKITGGSTLGAYSLWETVIPNASEPILQIHSREELGFFVIEGTVGFDVGRRHFQVSSNTFLNIPRDWQFGLRSESKELARVLVLAAPAGIEGIMREVGTPFGENATDMIRRSDAGQQSLNIIESPTSEEISTFRRIAPRYGVHVKT